ncbi:MAG TPA: MFS transporter [Acidimicrobiia bacterium]|nr:MFS transporter [Acidimicrobiia bacterium]
MSPLRDRRFVLLLAGQAVNGIGSWCALVALWGYAAFRFHASPAGIALLSLSWALPAALFGPFGGVPVDRFGPRRVLVVADGCAVLVSVALVFASSFNQLVVLGACVGLTRCCSDPAFSALAPRLFDDDLLLRANALLGAAMMSSIAFGPLLAAVAIATWGPRGAFVADAITYVIGIAVVLPLRLRPLVSRGDGTGAAPRPSAWRELREGFAFVRGEVSVQRVLVLATSVYVVWGAYTVIEPLYVRDVLHRPPATFALLQAAFGALLVVNALALSRFDNRIARMRTLRAAALGAACAAPLYVGTHSILVAFTGIAIWGSATAWFVAPRDTLLQRSTPIAAHGRVLAIDITLRSWAHVVALPVAVLLAGHAGVRATALTFAAVPVLGVVATRRARDVAVPIALEPATIS